MPKGWGNSRDPGWGNNNGPGGGIILTLGWGIMMALIQKKWGIVMAPDTVAPRFICAVIEDLFIYFFRCYLSVLKQQNDCPQMFFEKAADFKQA